MIRTEKWLQRLEDELKAIKATYTIYGGAMKTYLSYSDRYTINDVFGESPLVLKFTPSFGSNEYINVASFTIEQTITGSDSTINLSEYTIISEQHGDGTVTFKIPLLVMVDTVRVGIASTVPGTFTRI